MVAGWLNHQELKIIKGIGKTPGDEYSAEPNPVVINLLTDSISLKDWSPQIAPIKNGGVWVDSPLNDGRQLIAAPSGNVIEKMVVTIKGNSYLDAQKQLSGLNQVVLDCRDFWQTDFQIQPIYLAWWAGCGVGLQYAMIYNIDLAADYDDGPAPIITVTMNIEREPYWRGIPPGANPKIWTYYVNASKPRYNVNTASLITGTDHLVAETINNKHEWNPAAYGLQLTPYTKNYIDIPAALVPGDAPALVQLYINTNQYLPYNTYVGRSSKPYVGRGHDNVNRATALNLAAGDATTSGSASKSTSGGIFSNGSIATTYLTTRTSTGISGAWVNHTIWGGSTGATIKLDREFYRGTFAVFCRCRNASGTPVVTDMRMRLVVDEMEDNANQYINSVTLPEVNPQVDQISLAYMGALTLPFETRAVESLLGYGLQLQEANSNLRFTLQYRVDVATANRILEVIDLILIPMDECMAQIVHSYANGATATGSDILDNTGYLTRGENRQVVSTYITNSNSGGVSQEVRGSPLTLAPRVAQRLYFLTDGYYISTAAPYPSSLPQAVVIKLNIVPRWSGIRDV